jgi:hypothetical protein
MADDTKQCPFCGEDIKAVARVCRYCLTDIDSTNQDHEGTFVTVRIKVKEQTYTGDIFVPHFMRRLSDVINDRRHFITLSNAYEDTGMKEVPVGFLAINKNQIEKIELKRGTASQPMMVHTIEWK